mmetsp:Transcript_59281/g.123844  ORF Transcript_59281/g.123844 Transcript_59281/m.123844 type:complete len:84 (+) Transcript_59281:186-437(+)
MKTPVYIGGGVDLWTENPVDPSNSIGGDKTRAYLETSFRASDAQILNLGQSNQTVSNIFTQVRLHLGSNLLPNTVQILGCIRP